MNKIVNLFAITAVAIITTAMNGAVPPSGKEQAREVPRIRVGGSLLPEPAVRCIQEYVHGIPVWIENGFPSKMQVQIINSESREQISATSLDEFMPEGLQSAYSNFFDSVVEAVKRGLPEGETALNDETVIQSMTQFFQVVNPTKEQLSAQQAQQKAKQKLSLPLATIEIIYSGHVADHSRFHFGPAPRFPLSCKFTLNTDQLRPSPSKVLTEMLLGEYEVILNYSDGTENTYPADGI